MKLINLKKASWECIHFVADDLNVSLTAQIRADRLQLFVINDDTIQNDSDLFEAISLAMKLPDYFGKNWDALDECLTDLDRIDNPQGYVLLLKHSNILWQNAAFSMGKLIRSWLFAAEEWSKSQISFHLIFAEMELPNIASAAAGSYSRKASQ